MKKLGILSALAVAITAVAATLNYNQNIVAIFGAGNPDTGWTTAIGDNGLVLGLRAKNREDGSTANVSGVYNEPVGLQAPNNNRARWNWELSINSGSVSLDTYDYYVGIDTDLSTAAVYMYVNALTFWNDSSYGDSTTLNGQGVEGPASTLAPISTVVQQSQNIMFYPGQNATLDATYDYVLFAVAKGAGPTGVHIATVAIKVVVGAGGPPPPDSDGDGIPDYLDACDNTPTGNAVDVTGCSIQDYIDQCAIENASDHGEYVSCVVEKANELFKAGIISKDSRKLIINNAAQSSVGK